MPWYRSEKNPLTIGEDGKEVHGKIEEPITDEDFKEGMEHGKFLNPKHRAFCELLYYSAVRKAEALRAVREQFQITRTAIKFDVGERMKKVKRLKVCPQCRTKNGKKTLACRKCYPILPPLKKGI